MSYLDKSSVEEKSQFSENFKFSGGLNYINKIQNAIKLILSDIKRNSKQLGINDKAFNFKMASVIVYTLRNDLCTHVHVVHYENLPIQ